MTELRSDDRLIKYVFRSLLTVYVVSMVSVILCVLIDAAVTGQFLGTGAVTATGLLTPVVTFCSMLCALPGVGISAVCTRYMGMADVKKVNQAFSLIFYATFAVSLIVSIVLFAAAPSIAAALSTGTNDPQIAADITAYLKGIAFGRLFAGLSVPLNGIMMIDNDKNRVVIATMATLLVDAVLDFANVLVFHGGMFGMAMATSVSGIAAFLILMLHFRKKDRIIRFTAAGLAPSDIGDSVLAGLVVSIGQAGIVLRGLLFNKILLIVAGAGAVASLSVANNAFAVIMLLFLALVSTTSTLCSMFCGEEDRSALVKTMRLSFRYTFVIMLAVAMLFLIFARPVAAVFLKSNAVEELTGAARFIRFLTIQYVISALSHPVVGGLIGTKHERLNFVLSILKEAVFPAAAVVPLGLLFGLHGVEAGFVVTGLFVLLSTVLVPWIAKKKVPASAADFVLLPQDFPAEDTSFEVSVKNIEEVIRASEQVRAYCLREGADDRAATVFSLFVEEMAGNVVQHGFKGKKGESIDLRLIYRKDEQIIRLRDNGKLFDPVEWLERNHPEDPLKGAGIRIVIGMAKDVNYIPALKLNNLIVTV